MGACKSCLSEKGAKDNTVKVSGSGRRGSHKTRLRAVDSLYVADIRKKKTSHTAKAKQLKILHFNDSYNIQAPD